MKIPKKICSICRKIKKDDCDRCKKKPFEGINTANQSFYNSTRWRKIAKGHKTKHPLCEECLDKGIVTAVQITDHIIPIDKGGNKFSSDNLRSLCHKCHNKKSGRSK